GLGGLVSEHRAFRLAHRVQHGRLPAAVPIHPDAEVDLARVGVGAECGHEAENRIRNDGLEPLEHAADPRCFAPDRCGKRSQAPAPAANPATAQELPQVVVIANAPLSGLGLPANEIPANVQTADSRQMQRQQSLDLADYLNAGFSGVSASGSAANPFQMDVNYHGFTASPLLGTPEGLSVYVDGVRVNESFGDTVNWDLIPQSAISTVT